MSAALQRLAGRATGALTGGLRPRLPSRFETVIREPGLQEIHAEVASRAAPTPSPLAAGPVDEHIPSTATAIAEPPLQPRSPAAAPKAADPRSAHLAPEIPARPERRATVAAEPARSAAPEPLLQEMAALEAPPAPMVADILAVREMPATARARVAPPAAPEPLLAPAPVSRMPDALPVVPPTRPSGRAAWEPAAQPLAPEITIQIGRLDIREAARQASTPPRTVQSRPLPALADYLRRGRS